jgi:hypothetical protein
MTQIANFAAIPFLDHSNLQGRFLCSLFFYNGEWHSWIEAGDRIVKAQMWPAEAMYFGTSPELQTDIGFHFLDTIAQKLSFLPLSRTLFGIQDDVFNLSASLAKVRLLHEAKKDIKNGISRMVATEVEYMHGVCRSLFDLWQHVLITVWNNIELLDAKTKKKELPNSYRRMLFEANKLRTVDDLTERFGIPAPLAECYVRSAGFFVDLRKLRDNVIHLGSSVQVIFEGENGFLISEKEVPFRGLSIWHPEEREPNDLVPLLPALAYVVWRTLGTCDEFSRTIARIFLLPPPIVPKMSLYLRGYFNDILMHSLEDTRRRAVPELQT